MATEAPVKLTVPAPATGAKVKPAPQPLTKTFGVGATTIAPGNVGNVSLNATPVNASAAFGLLMLKVNLVGTLRPTGLFANALVIVGACTATVNTAVAATVFAPPLFVVNAPTPIVFV
jgi:hypothetical protein